MKTTHTRKPLHQQAEPEQKGPFFSKANDDVKKKDDVFFQTKLAVGEPGDKHEQEADAVADKVQRKTEEKKEKPELQKKGKEEEKPAAADGSAKEEDKGKVSKKEEEKKETVQKKEKEEEKPVQKMSGGDKKEEDKSKVSKKEDEQKDKVQKKEKEEEKPVQKMSGSDKKEEDKTNVKKKEASNSDTTVMTKEAGGVHPAAHPVSLEERIKHSKGKGQSLPDEVRNLMETEIGADFSEVVIHTDNESVAMNQELNSLAFTTGYDIYFNAGQYKPNTAEGQKLLAHELTHVVQQTGVSNRKDDKKREDKK
jgi:hypothetical protein